ncbi:Uncharacterized conserved protein RhaS [Pseudomonas syringae pv. actinidiae]|uniref:Uncharacterized conserved protein RhaS n=1 Tax=Pseudomonas syringae pv. actinidiae TaxID=103796 RepID=A0A2V0QC41_PSESF|nr:Uncharacterized conserved protein RhaS [Pseudomonas syringae pv. actinidiae]
MSPPNPDGPGKWPGNWRRKLERCNDGSVTGQRYEGRKWTV